MTEYVKDQWLRRIGLIVYADEKGLDLSEMHIKFTVTSADSESPNNAAIRIYNLSPETLKRIIGDRTVGGEFTRVCLNAGYMAGGYGIIFNGTIKQYRVGRENETDTYLDILAADGDVGYNQGFVNTSLAAGRTPEDAIKASVKAMSDAEAAAILATTGKKPEGPVVTPDIAFSTDKQHVPTIRGQVLFGLARAKLRNLASHLDSSWSVQDGKVVILPNTRYREGEAVVLSVATGLIGRPEQTGGGIKVKCLLNSRIKLGGLVKLNNNEIMKTMQSSPDAAPIPYNQWTGFQNLAPLSPDGTYRAYVIDHEGDTRGMAWYSHLTCLAVDLTAPPNKAVKQGMS